MRLFDQSGTAVELAGEIARGGEGTVYLVRGRPDQVAKLLHERARTRERRDKLSAMLALAPADPMRGQGRRSIAWPEELLFTDDRGERCAGFLMPRAAAGAFTWFAASQPDERQRLAPFFTFRHLLMICRNLASALAAVHAAGHCVGDLNESNLLVTPDALVLLVDTDSFQVAAPGQRTFRCAVGKPEFTAPELAGCSLASTDRTPASDVYALAILMFQMLMQGYHPYSGVWSCGEPAPLHERMVQGLYTYADVPGVTPPVRAPAIAILPPALCDAFRLMFVESVLRPEIRPPASQWVTLIDQVMGELVPCSNSTVHLYGSHLAACPWCDSDLFPEVTGLQVTLPHGSDPHGSDPHASDPAKLVLSVRQLRFTRVVPAAPSPSQTISYSNTGKGALRATIRVEPEGIFLATPVALEHNQGKITITLATRQVHWERSYRATLTVAYNGVEPGSHRTVKLFADAAPALFIQRWLVAKVRAGQWLLFALGAALGLWAWSQWQDLLVVGVVSTTPLLLHTLTGVAAAGLLRRWLLRGSRLRRWLAVALLWAPGLGLGGVLGLSISRHVSPWPVGAIQVWRASPASAALSMDYEVSAPLGTYARPRKDCDALDAAVFLPRAALVQLADTQQNQPGDVPGPCAANGWSRITEGWVPSDSIRQSERRR